MVGGEDESVDGVRAARLCGGAQRAAKGAEEALGGEDECDDVWIRAARLCGGAQRTAGGAEEALGGEDEHTGGEGGGVCGGPSQARGGV